MDSLERVVTGSTFVVFPLIWVFGFLVHPNLLEPQWFLNGEGLILRARGNALLQFGHALVTLNAAAIVPIAIHFRVVLFPKKVGYVGAALAILGGFLLAADKGALYLTMSALDALSDEEFEKMMPGLNAIFSFEGWMFLVWGLVLMPIGVLIQIVAMMKAKSLPKWQLRTMLVGVLLVGFPDGSEIVNLMAAISMAIAMVPYGISLLSRGKATRQDKMK
jgi:hypothetical protein